VSRFKCAVTEKNAYPPQMFPPADPPPGGCVNGKPDGDCKTTRRPCDAQPVDEEATS